MENEETKVDEKLKSAFNDGYILGLNKSDLAGSLEKSYSKGKNKEANNIDLLFEGLKEGILTKERINRVERNLESIRSVRDSKDIDFDISR